MDEVVKLSKELDKTKSENLQNLKTLEKSEDKLRKMTGKMLETPENSEETEALRNSLELKSKLVKKLQGIGLEILDEFWTVVDKSFVDFFMQLVLYKRNGIFLSSEIRFPKS